MPTQLYKTKSGVVVPSVTTIIGKNLAWGKDVLMRWAHKQGKLGIDIDEKLVEAGNAGTLAHYLIECYLCKIEPDLASEEYDIEDKEIRYANQAFESFLSWRASNTMEVIENEIPLVSEEYQFGGCIDAIARVKDKVCVMDFKTNRKGPYISAYIQVSAYSMLWDEHNPDNKIQDGAHILRVDKFRKNFTHYYYGDLEPGKKVFKMLLELDKMRVDLGE